MKTDRTPSTEVKAPRPAPKADTLRDARRIRDILGRHDKARRDAIVQLVLAELAAPAEVSS